jgi:hypothetical protein
MLKTYTLGARISLFKDILRKLQKDNNDRGVGILTQVLFKAQFTEEPEHVRTLIELARDYWFPRTLNCLRDSRKYILDIVDTLQQAMALLIFLLILEKNQDI